MTGYSKARKRSPLTVIRDTREQYEPTWPDGIACQTAKLDFADYSAEGLTDFAAARAQVEPVRPDRVLHLRPRPLRHDASRPRQVPGQSHHRRRPTRSRVGSPVPERRSTARDRELNLGMGAGLRRSHGLGWLTRGRDERNRLVAPTRADEGQSAEATDHLPTFRR